jgi:hypothetical protein
MKWDRFVTPFSYGMWLTVAINICALAVCLAVTNYSHERKKILNFSAIFFSIHACFCRQGESYRTYFMPFLFPYILNPVS